MPLSSSWPLSGRNGPTFSVKMPGKDPRAFHLDRKPHSEQATTVGCVSATLPRRMIRRTRGNRWAYLRPAMTWWAIWTEAARGPSAGLEAAWLAFDVPPTIPA
jgi:hypothetical protein